ncbi:MAG: GNAT family N-acetyltransferase [Actinomycetota bacterium]
MRFELDPQLTPALRRELVELWTAVSDAGGSVGFVPPVTIERVEPVASDAFARVTEGLDHLVVGYEGKGVVGFGFLESNYSALRRHWATVKRLQVHPELQGTGRGGELLDAMATFGRELGYDYLHLTVRGGTGTERFYERHGYETVGRLPNAIRVGPDDDRDEIYMVRRL